MSNEYFDIAAIDLGNEKGLIELGKALSTMLDEDPSTKVTFEKIEKGSPVDIRLQRFADVGIPAIDAYALSIHGTSDLDHELNHAAALDVMKSLGEMFQVWDALLVSKKIGAASDLPDSELYKRLDNAVTGFLNPLDETPLYDIQVEPDENIAAD